MCTYTFVSERVYCRNTSPLEGAQIRKNMNILLVIANTVYFKKTWSFVGNVTKHKAKPIFKTLSYAAHLYND